MKETLCEGVRHRQYAADQEELAKLPNEVDLASNAHPDGRRQDLDVVQGQKFIDAVAAEQGYSITHSAVTRFGSRSQKFTPRKRLSARGRPVRMFSLVAVPDPFITVIQDSLLYADLGRDGVSFTIAARGISVDPFVQLHLEAMQAFATRVEGYAAFLLPASELAATTCTA